MPPVRILHASDLHISTNPGVTSVFDNVSAGMYLSALRSEALASTYDSFILQRLVDLIAEDYQGIHIKQAAYPLDAVVLTGDLATTGSQLDLEQAVKLVDGPLHPYLANRTPDFVPSLAAVGTPVWLLPGNHDRLAEAKITKYSPGGKIFDTLFAPHWPAPVTEYSPILRRSGLSVAILGADFNLQHKSHRDGRLWWNKCVQGRVYPRILGNLELTTRKIQAKHARTSADTLAVIWAIHFPPKSPAIASSMKLIDDQELVNAANRCDATAILAGHTHEPVRYQTPDITSKRPGSVVQSHDEVFFEWRKLIETGKLTAPFKLAHVDAHSDLGMGFLSWPYLHSDFLSLNVKDRPYANQGVDGINFGSFLAFALGCRWISETDFIINKNWHDDILRSLLTQPSYELVEDKAPMGVLPYGRYDLEIELMQTPKWEPTSSWEIMDERKSIGEPRIPFNIIPIESIGARYSNTNWDYVFLSHSPGYVPSYADHLLEHIARYIAD